MSEEGCPHKIMKILQINKFFYLKGGSERYFFNLCELLQEKGHQVIHFSSKHKKNLPSIYSSYFISEIDYRKTKGILEKIKNAMHIFSNPEANLKLEKLIIDTKPDIAHLHNIYHQISFSILPLLKKYKIPIVMTLHDWKLICPNYRLYTKGKICEKCNRKKYYNAFLNKCVLDSYLISGICCLEAYFNYLKNIYKHIDLFIAPSKFLKAKFVQFGFPEQKIVYLPNFVPPDITHISEEPLQDLHNKNNPYILYFGRLSKEKGLFTLLNAMKFLPEITLKISGTGEEEGELKKFTKRNSLDNVQFLGYNRDNSLKRIIRQSMFVVIPSEWYENFPVSVLEAFSLKKPVIASNIGGLPELVKNNKTGLLFEPGNYIDLKCKIEDLFNNSKKIKEMGENAKKLIEEKYNSELHYRKIIKIYASLIH